MRLRVLAIGKPKLAFAKSGVEEYLNRISPFNSVQLDFLKSGTRETESEVLHSRSHGMLRVVLDEHGEEVSSRGLADRFTAWERTPGIKEVAFLIGGADGHTEALIAGAAWKWSLSRLTLQHEMALVLVLEQIYRAYTIKSGGPYHRD
jgi:23S rRNA (pseudouridine1915-N3)-methyltransferase